VAAHRIVPQPVAGPRAIETGVAALVPDRDGRRGWTLYVNGMESSHVDLDDPTRLDFEYMRWLVGAIETLPPRDRDGDGTSGSSGASGTSAASGASPARPRVLHLGGGGCTLARYLAAVLPGARQVVVEIDEGLLELTKQAFGLRSTPALRLRVGEARAVVAGEPDARYDIVIRDAFTGSSVPAHLLTRSFVAEVARVLRPGGLYLANLADGELLATARREAATVLSVFAEAAVVAEPGQLRGRRYGNIVIAGSHAPLPLADWGRRLACDPVRARLLAGDRVRAFASGRAPFEDDPAPADAEVRRGSTTATG
jgi:spermidine synthase